MSLSGIVGQGINELGIRFNIVGLIPTSFLFVFILSLFLLWSDKPSPVPDWNVLIQTIDDIGIEEGVLLVILLLLFSLILHPLQLPLMRVLEGYWGNSIPARTMAKFGRSIELSRFKKQHELARTDAEGFFTFRQRFPNENRLLPTSLGNILRAAEDLVYTKYSLEAVAVWPIIYPILSDASKAIIDSQRNQLDMTIRLCAIFVICSVISSLFFLGIIVSAIETDIFYSYMIQTANEENILGPLTIITASLVILITYSFWLLFPISMGILAWLTYKAALSAARSYGKSINTAFDLHRFELLKSLHFRLPKSLPSEKSQNAEISEFFVRGKDYKFTYDNEESKQSK